MKPSGIFIFLPAIVLITFFGFGAGTALAHSSPGTGSISPNDTQVFSNSNEARIGVGLPDGSAGLGSTHAATGSKRRAFVGTVTLTGSNPVTGSEPLMLTLVPQGTGEDVVINLLPGFEFKTPGRDDPDPFTGEARVVILAQRVDGGWEAIRGLIKPEKLMYSGHTVVVTDVDEGVVTGESQDGDTQTFTLPDEVGDVTPGEVVTVFEEESGKVTGLVKADQVRSRLNQFLEDAEDEEGDDESSEEIDQRSRRVQALALVLEKFGAHHLEMLNRVADRVPERVRRHIESMKARVESDSRNSRAIIERVIAKLRGRDGEGDLPGHGDNPSEDKGKPVDHAGGQDHNRGRGAGGEDRSGNTSPGKPATVGGPRIDSQGDADGGGPPEDDESPGFGGKGKNR